MIQLKIRGVDHLIKKYGYFGARDFLVETTRRAVVYVHSEIPDYPPQSGKPMRFKSERQRRFVMWLVSIGKVPYRRTVQLWRSITSWAGHHPGALSRVENRLGVIAGIVGTNLRYAPWVIDENRQAAYHRGNWWTLQGVVRKIRPGIVRVYEAAIRRALKS